MRGPRSDDCRRPPLAAETPAQPSPPQNASHGATHDGAADRAAHLAANRFADVGRDLARDAVADRTRHLPRDHLTGGKPRSARTRGAEDVAQHAADTAQYRAEAAGRLRLPRPGRRMRCSNRPAHGAGLQALLQELVGGFGIDGLIVLTLDRA